MGLVLGAPSAQPADMTVFGRVVAPCAVGVSDLTLEGPHHTYPGDDTLQLRLVLHTALHSTQSAEELTVSLGVAAAALCVDATLDALGTAPQFLQHTISADVPGRCVVITLVVPLTAPVGASVRGVLSLAGKPVPWLLGALVVVVGGSSVPPCRTNPVCTAIPLLSFLQHGGPDDLTPEQADELQALLPPGARVPGAWREVYRATRHGFSAAAFHAHCDGQQHLLLLIRVDGGHCWLFGGYTAVGFSPPQRAIADSAAFLFSLTNALGHPERLPSLGTGMDLLYMPFGSASFGDGAGLALCDSANQVACSSTNTGVAYAESASAEAHPMAQGYQAGWLAAEVTAWVV